jgi:hypothetical protein
LSLFAVSERASAATLVQTTISSTTALSYSAPAYQGAPPTPVASTGSFHQDVTGNNATTTLDPYNGTNGATLALQYSAIGPGFTAGSATYNIGSSSVTVLWGSPDTYNEMEFFSAANAGGTLLDAINCSALTATGCSSSGYDLVTFSFSPSTVIGSIVMEDPGTLGSSPANQSFEYDVVTSATPLPAALPLFAGGLGLMGLLGRRKKRKQQVALPT